jgi:hypothetical protein
LKIEGAFEIIAFELNKKRWEAAMKMGAGKAGERIER